MYMETPPPHTVPPMTYSQTMHPWSQKSLPYIIINLNKSCETWEYNNIRKARPENLLNELDKEADTRLLPGSHKRRPRNTVVAPALTDLSHDHLYLSQRREVGNA